jgi:cysteine synthase A
VIAEAIDRARGTTSLGLNTDYVREAAVDDASAIVAARHLLETEGVLAGISSGATLSVALRLCARESWRGRRFVIGLSDGGERYLSTALFRR